MLKGKSAIVTGSTSGIGLGIAEALAAEGVNVLFNGFGDQKEIDATVSGVAKKFGVKTAYSAADMSKAGDIRAMVKQAEDAFGAVDILVNNAGIQFTSPVADFPEEKWDAIIAINLSSAFHAAKAALPGMQARNWGRIINVASAHGLVGSANKSAYVAAKHGVVGLTKVTALEMGEAQITANAICPGWVLTPLVQKQIDDRAAKEGKPADAISKAMLAEKQSTGRFSTPEQIGALTVFLCSEAACNITGTTHSIDGGWTAA
jgi:3-hydroxybutyrate dehydrogenase